MYFTVTDEEAQLESVAVERIDNEDEAVIIWNDGPMIVKFGTFGSLLTVTIFVLDVLRPKKFVSVNVKV